MKRKFSKIVCIWLCFTSPATTGITKDIVGYDNEGGGYYLIASPVGEVNPDNVDKMKSNTYDLYWFKQDGDDEGKEWMNYKTESFNLVPGKGYLYANSQDITLTFFGNAYTGNGTFPKIPSGIVQRILFFRRRIAASFLSCRSCSSRLTGC